MVLEMKAIKEGYGEKEIMLKESRIQWRTSRESSWFAVWMRIVLLQRIILLGVNEIKAEMSFLGTCAWSLHGNKK